LYQAEAPVALAATPGPIGGAALRVLGRDVALAGWDAAMPQLIEAICRLREDGVEAAVLDLHWLSPLSDAALSDTVMSCQDRAVVVHDANLTGRFDAEVAARLHERHGPEAIRVFRVTNPYIRVPAAPSPRWALLRDAAATIRAARALASARQLQADPA